jgi:hypothetical protein
MARVVSNVDADLRIGVAHVVDRVCVGRCYSYANYEPSTGQFRIRVTGPTSIVAASVPDSSSMETGKYIVREGDLPLYRVSAAADGRLVVDSMTAGAAVGVSEWRGFARLR